uniref:Ankyrin repeat and SOCS box protein 17 n=1 Tax=Graphocephala atropunctata TaxID=36148 RepID=A0A1B6M6C2_9HEMI
MDIILDCVFDQVFSRLDRGCLLARYKRRHFTDYLSTVIRGSSGEDTQEGCERAVQAALRFHRTSRQENGEICLLGKYHNVLYVAATLCYDWQLQDTPTVAQLLQDIFACERTFERLIVGAILGTKVTHLISGWKSDFRTREECILAVKYFSDHAARANLQFDCSGEPTNFVDVPMESYGRATPLRVAAQAGQADILKLLLHYGATVTPEPPSIDTCALQPLLHRMNDLCHDHPGERIAQEYIHCVNLLLRELPMLPTLLPYPEDDLPTDPMAPPESRDLHPRIYALVPPQRSGYLTAPCLRHMCRCVVRQQLRTSGLIPHGVSMLLLPDSVIHYLSHEEE